ncbi:MAG: hypothetical protein ACPG31_01115 [Planctomycetota bacterium]
MMLRRTPLTLMAVGCLTGILLANPHTRAWTMDWFQPGDKATAIAKNLREAARHQAHADFHLKLATSGNRQQTQAALRSNNAWLHREEALALAEEQFTARMDAFVLLEAATWDPIILADDYESSVTNPYFPLVPGRTMVYERDSSEGVERVEITTLQRTLEVEGVTCRVVREYETLDGVLTEDTYNWFAQHQHGAVWYFGESVLHYLDGFLENLDGSWRSGHKGARPGKLMTAVPQVGHTYRQEYALGISEDLAQVLSIGNTVTVPAGTFTDCVEIVEYTPLDPQDVVAKYYAPGYGMVLEIDLTDGERLELLEVR